VWYFPTMPRFVFWCCMALILCDQAPLLLAQHQPPAQSEEGSSKPVPPYTAYSAEAYSAALAPWRQAFDAAYAAAPELPRGLLEALAWSRTHARHRLQEEAPPSCMGLPAYHGLFGLVEDGRGWFRNQVADHVETLRKIEREETEQEWIEQKETEQQRAEQPMLSALKRAPAVQTGAVALHLAALFDAPSSLPSEQDNMDPANPLNWYEALLRWSELPLETPGASAAFVRDAFAYGVFQTLADPAFRQALGLEGEGPDLEAFFGPARFAALTASRRSDVPHSAPGLLDQEHKDWEHMDREHMDRQHMDREQAIPEHPDLRHAGAESLSPCNDYGPANWTAASSSNYSSRSGTAISAVTLHTMQGYYAGTLSWFQNPSANVSAHYVMRASDGQITQMVCEADKAWHVGSENPYTVGIEHEGFVSDPSWYTPTVYNASAALTRDIAEDHGILKLRTYAKAGTSGLLTLGGCTRIKGHQHFPFQSHTDPGIHWDWAHYYKLVNEPAPAITYTSSSGSFADPGGSGAYGDDQRRVWIIDPPGTAPVTLSFSSFDLETDWDYLYLYDGNSIYAPLIGAYTGTIGPGTLSSSGGAITVEFRSDCATTAAGFNASWNSSGGGGSCSTPTGTYTGPIGWTSATINWSPVAVADDYTVAGRRQGSSAWRTLSTPLSSKWLGIFQEGTSYEWRVRAECGSSSSSWSGINSFTTNSLRQAGLGETEWRILDQPVQNRLRLEGLPDQAQLEVFNAMGQPVARYTYASGAAFPLPAGEAGWYGVRAIAPNGKHLGQRIFIRQGP
jgi:N-acetyl-anhydromuramyl-L-alanine amidase AmpD